MMINCQLYHSGIFAFFDIFKQTKETCVTAACFHSPPAPPKIQMCMYFALAIWDISRLDRISRVKFEEDLLDAVKERQN